MFLRALKVIPDFPEGEMAGSRHGRQEWERRETWFWKYQYQCQYRYQNQEWERRETRGKRPRPPPSRLIEFVCTRVKIKNNDYSTMLKPAIPPSSALRPLGYNPGPAFAEGSPPEVYLLPQPDKKIALGCLSNTSSP